MNHCSPGKVNRRNAFVTATLLAGLLAATAWSAEPAASPASSPAVPAAVLLAPTLGRPVFTEPGASFEALAQAPDATEPVEIKLVSSTPPAVSCSLAEPADALSCISAGRPLLLHVPPDVPERTYDLQITTGGTRLVGRHCVAVKRLGPRIRLVHLSNMNIGDVAAPDFDSRLITEVNLAAPDLIIASGDFVDRTAENPDAIWQRLPEFFSRFDAPAFIACGDHDDLERYSRYVAVNPIGTVELGFLRGFAIYDRPSRPISDDPGQQQWLEHVLAAPGDERLKFVLTHDDRPNLLLDWQKRGVLADMISSTRLGLWVCGSHRDWDGVEYADIAREAAPLLYVRTHQSSTATLDGASGISHFRVLDVTEERVAAPGWDSPASTPPPSLATGLLTCSTDCPNDGSENRVGVTVVNNHPFRMNGLEARVLVAGRPQEQPWCLGAELVSSQFVGGVWVCRLRFDLPDKGVARALVGCGATPVLPRLTVRFELPTVLKLVRQQTPEGLSYATAGDVNALIYVTNTGATAADITPLLRLDGDALSYKVVEEPGPPAAAYHLHLAPERSVTLQPDLSALRAATGRRELQVYMTGLPAWTPACQPLTIVESP
jgi:hypothetical protein